MSQVELFILMGAAAGLLAGFLTLSLAPRRRKLADIFVLLGMLVPIAVLSVNTWEMSHNRPGNEVKLLSRLVPDKGTLAGFEAFGENWVVESGPTGIRLFVPGDLPAATVSTMKSRLSRLWAASLPFGISRAHFAAAVDACWKGNCTALHRYQEIRGFPLTPRKQPESPWVWMRRMPRVVVDAPGAAHPASSGLSAKVLRNELPLDSLDVYRPVHGIVPRPSAVLADGTRGIGVPRRIP